MEWLNEISIKLRGGYAFLFVYLCSVKIIEVIYSIIGFIYNKFKE